MNFTAKSFPTAFLRSTVALTTAVLSTFSTLSPASAVNFGQKEVNQNKFIAVASPYGTNRYQLAIFEQISNKKSCWSEKGTSPTSVDLLLKKFDFTGICGRSTDSNGYSIRKGGQDLGWRYELYVVKQAQKLVLVGVNTTNRNLPPIEIGTTSGITNGVVKINLNPGWRFAKRTYNGKVLGHVYLTSDS